MDEKYSFHPGLREAKYQETSTIFVSVKTYHDQEHKTSHK